MLTVHGETSPAALSAHARNGNETAATVANKNPSIFISRPRPAAPDEQRRH
ncbi:MAG: hypothetical protein LBF50_07990 [Azoarcus sp.]|nr:hypothetical protein [Azoarcus sp.]